MCSADLRRHEPVHAVNRALPWLVVAACGGGGSDPDAQQGPDAPNSSATPLVGTFQVSLVPSITTGGTTAPAYSSLLGKVYNGATLDAIVWETAASMDGCTLLTPRVPFCATPCGTSAVCVENDTCKPYPMSQTVGTITATGIATVAGDDMFSMDPIANAYQPPASKPLAYPAFREGEKLELVTSGSAFAPSFTVGTRGVAALNITSTAIALESGSPLALTWTAPTAMGSKIHIKLDISHHGGSKGKIECDVADSGSVSIASALVTQLLGLGAAGYPTIIVTRATTGSAAISAGRIDLVAASTVEKPVSVPGVTSCTQTDECPMGQTCQPDLTCR
ncbi:hypothetical protein BH11MYX3_BH11MYX3_09040 [soil metagenome]